MAVKTAKKSVRKTEVRIGRKIEPKNEERWEKRKLGMYVVVTYFNGAKKIIEDLVPGLLDRTIKTLKSLKPYSMIKTEYETKIKNKKKIKETRAIFDGGALNRKLKVEFKKEGWQAYWRSYFKIDYSNYDIGEKRPSMKISDLNKPEKSIITYYKETDFYRDNIAMEVQFAHDTSTSYDLFQKFPSLYKKEKIKVGIEICPTTEMMHYMTSKTSSYDKALNHILEFEKDYKFPLILIGLTPEKIEDYSAEEILKIYRDESESKKQLNKFVS